MLLFFQFSNSAGDFDLAIDFTLEFLSQSLKRVYLSINAFASIKSGCSPIV